MGKNFITFLDGPSPERDELCERLGIQVPELDPKLLPFFGNVVVWAQIGVKLAEEQQEFHKRRRGRPALDGRDNDYWRAVYILRTKGSGTQAEAIRRAMDEGAKLFASDNFNSLNKSVSEGNKIIRKAVREIHTLMASGFRMQCEHLRQRKAHIEEMARLAEEMRKSRYGLFGYLSEMKDAKE